MNKHIFPVMVAGLLAMASCNKEAAVKSPGGQKQAQPATARMAGANFAFDTDGACALRGAECHGIPPVIIYDDCLKAIASAEAGGKRNVGDVFRSQLLQSLCAEMAVSLEQMLQSGNYYIRKNYEDAHVINYMVGSSYPVTVQNMATAFQLNK